MKSSAAILFKPETVWPWSLYMTDVSVFEGKLWSARLIDATCPLSQLHMIWITTLWQIHAPTDTNTQIKHSLSTHSFMYRIKRQIVHLSGECCSVLWLTLQQHGQQVIGKQKPVGQILWLDAAAPAISFVLSRPDRTVVSLTSDCACCFKITGRL